jgi:hypothetical protein
LYNAGLVFNFITMAQCIRSKSKERTVWLHI